MIYHKIFSSSSILDFQIKLLQQKNPSEKTITLDPNKYDLNLSTTNTIAKSSFLVVE
jgi:hypothetical protein